MDKVLFVCRKCGHNLILEVPEDETKEFVLKKLRKISKMDCPGCGESPYENWMISDVKIARKK